MQFIALFKLFIRIAMKKKTLRDCTKNCDCVFVVRDDYNTIDINYFLQKYHKTDNFIAIPIETLKYVCVYMKIDNQMYRNAY